MKKTFYLPMMIAAFTPSVFAADLPQYKDPSIPTCPTQGAPAFQEFNRHRYPLPQELAPFVTDVGVYGKTSLTMTEAEFEKYAHLIIKNHWISLTIINESPPIMQHVKP